MAKNKINNQDIAQEFVRHDKYIADMIYVSDWDTFYYWDENVYVERTLREMKKELHAFMISTFNDQNITEHLVSDVLQQVKWLIYRQVPSITSNVISLNDKMLDMETFELVKIDKRIISIHKVDVDAKSLKDPIPLFDNFLNSILVDENGQTDPELKTLVQEMFGFYLINELKPHAVFFLVGQGSNGKSVLLSLLESMIGKKFITAMSIQYLTTNEWATASLVGKKLNICNEEESKFLRSDKFKALVSGDMTQANRKYLDPIVFAPQTKYVFATNEMPTFEGLNLGLKRRIFIIPFNRIFQDHEQDKEMAQKLKGELGGIIAWAIEGAKRLRANGYNFSKSRQSSLAKAEFEEAVSSGLKFFNERYRVVDERIDFISSKDLYHQYVVWCQENGRKGMNSSNFFKDLRHNVPKFKDYESVARVDGSCIRGVWLEKRILPDPEVEIVSPLDDLILNQRL